MKIVDPMKTNRAASWKLYSQAPMPMVTIFKTLDISHLLELKKDGYKLNMLLCYCIAAAAENIEEFKLLPQGENMIAYDKIGVNVIVKNKHGSINACDIPFCNDVKEFHKQYLSLTHQVYETCSDHEIDDHMIIGTSSLIHYDIDGAVNMYSGIFNNPFIIWGKYQRKDNAANLKLSFQFHHVQMDGMEACEFLEELQRRISHLTMQ